MSVEALSQQHPHAPHALPRNLHPQQMGAPLPHGGEASLSNVLYTYPANHFGILKTSHDLLVPTQEGHNNGDGSAMSPFQIGDLLHAQQYKPYDGVYCPFPNRTAEDTGVKAPHSALDNNIAKWIHTLSEEQRIKISNSQDPAVVPSSYSLRDSKRYDSDSSSDDERYPEVGRSRLPSIPDELIQMDGEKAVKKKRRQEKNREAAQLFRQRQKAKVHDLERSVNELAGSNSEFRMKMEILAFENKILKDQLFYLKNLVASGILISGAASPFSPQMPFVPNLEKLDPSLMNLNGHNAPLNNNQQQAPPNNNSMPKQNNPPHPLQNNPLASLMGGAPLMGNNHMMRPNVSMGGAPSSLLSGIPVVTNIVAPPPIPVVNPPTIPIPIPSMPTHKEMGTPVGESVKAPQL